MSSIFQRVAAWLANEAVTGALARSPTFQKFAQVSHQHVTNISAQGARAAEKLKQSDAAKQLSTEAKAKMDQASTFSRSFVKNLKDNYKKLEEEGRRLEELERKRK